jgi:hypothetical protein
MTAGHPSVTPANARPSTRWLRIRWPDSVLPEHGSRLTLTSLESRSGRPVMVVVLLARPDPEPGWAEIEVDALEPDPLEAAEPAGKGVSRPGP